MFVLLRNLCCPYMAASAITIHDCREIAFPLDNIVLCRSPLLVENLWGHLTYAGHLSSIGHHLPIALWLREYPSSCFPTKLIRPHSALWRDLLVVRNDRKEAQSLIYNCYHEHVTHKLKPDLEILHWVGFYLVSKISSRGRKQVHTMNVSALPLPSLHLFRHKQRGHLSSLQSKI